MPRSPVGLLFIVIGLALVATGIAVVVDFREIGSRWEKGVHQSSAAVTKIARLSWPSNPYLGATFRPVVAIFFIVVGTILTGSVLLGAIR
jgi:hypothetical protein